MIATNRGLSLMGCPDAAIRFIDETFFMAYHCIISFH